MFYFDQLINMARGKTTKLGGGGGELIVDQLINMVRWKTTKLVGGGRELVISDDSLKVIPLPFNLNRLVLTTSIFLYADALQL